MRLRPLQADDKEALWGLLSLAAFRSREDAQSDPHVARYLTNFPRSDDFGFIAEDGDGSLLGGVWARCLEPSPTPTFVPPPGVPTISIATQPHVRGLGVGTALLYAIIESARKRTDCSALALHVRESNPARRLYQRVGFVDVPGAYFINSVGGNSFGMLLTLTDAARSR